MGDDIPGSTPRRGDTGMRWAAIAIATALAALMYVAVYGGSVIVSVERLTTSQYDVDGTATSPSAALDPEQWRLGC